MTSVRKSSTTSCGKRRTRRDTEGRNSRHGVWGSGSSVFDSGFGDFGFGVKEIGGYLEAAYRRRALAGKVSSGSRARAFPMTLHAGGYQQREEHRARGSSGAAGALRTILFPQKPIPKTLEPNLKDQKPVSQN